MGEAPNTPRADATASRTTWSASGSLSRRVGTATLVAVGGSAIAAAGSTLVVSALGGSVALQLAVAFAVSALAASVSWAVVRSTTTPSLERLALLTSRVQALQAAEELPTDEDVIIPVMGDPDGAPLAAALNAVLSRAAARQAEQDANLHLLSSLIENSPNGVLVCRPDGRIRTVNPAFRRLFELRGEPEGRRPTEVLAVPEVQELVDLAREGGYEDEVRLVPGIHTVVLRPIVTDGGEVGVLAQDITAYRAAERARTDFVANVSHELRTPMAAILGYAETLSQDTDRMPEDVRPLVEAISRNSRRLRDTFEGLMHLARVEARLKELALESLRLEPLLIQAVIPAVDAAGRKGLDFEVDCPPEVGVRTNAEAFDVILSNLCMNAVKYTVEGGVTVRVHVEDQLVHIDVIDTGIGIDPAHHDRIFERFFRVDDGRAREVGGTGLGLAMVKHLVLATGARISMTSEPGQGSTFTVLIPAADVLSDEVES